MFTYLNARSLQFILYSITTVKAAPLKDFLLHTHRCSTHYLQTKTSCFTRLGYLACSVVFKAITIVKCTLLTYYSELWCNLLPSSATAKFQGSSISIIKYVWLVKELVIIKFVILATESIPLDTSKCYWHKKVHYVVNQPLTKNPFIVIMEYYA